MFGWRYVDPFMVNINVYCFNCGRFTDVCIDMCVMISWSTVYIPMYNTYMTNLKLLWYCNSLENVKRNMTQSCMSGAQCLYSVYDCYQLLIIILLLLLLQLPLLLQRLQFHATTNTWKNPGIFSVKVCLPKCSENTCKIRSLRWKGLESLSSSCNFCS